MQSPLVRYPDKTVILPPQFCGSVGYYATMARYGKAIVHGGMRYDKRMKSTHRCLIADTHGPLSLTVPVRKPATAVAPNWASIEISDHDGWWNPMAESLESAYGRTPFFEFLSDRILPLLRYESGISVAAMDMELDLAIRRLLQIGTEVEYISSPDLSAEGCDDLRRADFTTKRPVPYYQVRNEKLGFIPDLSILDLIFNMGPEAQIILLRQGFLD